ncbi:hypothetical protein SASPL_130747 [Salvia splendens]|uniref:Uncharacterized protein n=1 Tax=Salvia splendens TaxID=180675 RepID=A0A8X8X8S6_SALSN|nr:hypothetical protein SASPL_130747 [Salvia splendens]
MRCASCLCGGAAAGSAHSNAFLDGSGGCTAAVGGDLVDFFGSGAVCIVRRWLYLYVGLTGISVGGKSLRIQRGAFAIGLSRQPIRSPNQLRRTYYSNGSKPSTSPSPANSPPHFSPHNATSPITPAQQLQAFLQLKYQWIHDPSQSPFATHPIANRVAVATSALHYLGCAVALSFPPLHRLAHHLIVSSGYAAVPALLSVILPDSAAQCVYVVFGLL